MTLEDRLNALLVPHGAESKRMFGGTCFLIGGNMLIGTLKDGLIVRVGREAHPSALRKNGASTFAMTGKSMAGFVTVAGEAVTDDDALRDWVKMALAFVKTLPPKPARK
jgi:TfoX/Sxy family transcriptional regulator of competence genes